MSGSKSSLSKTSMGDRHSCSAVLVHMNLSIISFYISFIFIKMSLGFKLRTRHNSNSHIQGYREVLMLPIQQPHLQMADLIFSISNFWHNRWTWALPQDCIVSLPCSVSLQEDFSECHSSPPSATADIQRQGGSDGSEKPQSQIWCQSVPFLPTLSKMQYPGSQPTHPILSQRVNYSLLEPLVSSVTNILL